jgi:opacity protein-like surface antigen
LAGIVTSSSATGNAWEFPLLAKYRLPMKIVHPYVDAGVAWDTLSGLTQAITSTVTPNRTTTTSNPAELNTTATRGFVMGAGLSVKVLVIHLSPEIRFTRWGAQHFIDPNGLLHSNLNQGEFLLGITF